MNKNIYCMCLCIQTWARINYVSLILVGKCTHFQRSIIYIIFFPAFFLHLYYCYYFVCPRTMWINWMIEQVMYRVTVYSINLLIHCEQADGAHHHVHSCMNVCPLLFFAETTRFLCSQSVKRCQCQWTACNYITLLKSVCSLLS